MVAYEDFKLSFLNHGNVSRWVDVSKSHIGVGPLCEINCIEMILLARVVTGHLERSGRVVKDVTVDGKLFWHFNWWSTII